MCSSASAWKASTPMPSATMAGQRRTIGSCDSAREPGLSSWRAAAGAGTRILVLSGATGTYRTHPSGTLWSRARASWPRGARWETSTSYTSPTVAVMRTWAMLEPSRTLQAGPSAERALSERPSATSPRPGVSGPAISWCSAACRPAPAAPWCTSMRSCPPARCRRVCGCSGTSTARTMWRCRRCTISTMWSTASSFKRRRW
mmetsp:Transcript_75885/g.219147  ORF Transcript_75885/g.219147 Transcript_75885/m.219147 type:complete len:202 (-) Transcript_75885:467-1072(-)